MGSESCKVLLVGSLGLGRLEGSYLSAFTALGCRPFFFDMEDRIGHYCRLGRVGRTLNQFLPVEPWIRKANRDLVATALELRPDAVLVVGSSRVRSGALAQLAASCNARLALVWVDTLLNLDSEIIVALPMYDAVFSYGRAPAGCLERLGARRVKWLPLAADPTLHGSPQVDARERQIYACDVSFVGNWRREREETLTLVGSMEGIGLKIWGGDAWKRCGQDNPTIRRAWQGRALVGADFARAMVASKISLNIIDPTNYPCANMRFFEIPCAGSLQVCSPCPEMEDEFRHGEALFYYRDPRELPGLIREVLRDEDLRRSVAKRAQERVLETHTYAHRSQEILAELGLRT